MLWEEEPRKCVGWLNKKKMCIDYQEYEFLCLVKSEVKE